MAFNKGDKSDSSRVRRGGMHRRKKVCVFCGDKNGEIDYKDVNKLKRYVSERGKILPRRITGNCANGRSSIKTLHSHSGFSQSYLYTFACKKVCLHRIGVS